MAEETFSCVGGFALSLKPAAQNRVKQTWCCEIQENMTETAQLKTGSGITLEYCGYSVFNLATFLLDLAASYFKLEKVGNTVEKSWCS